MSRETGHALIDLNKKFDSFFILLKEMDDRLFTASNKINNIDHRLCNIESTLKVDSATHRDTYFNSPKPGIDGPSANWEGPSNDWEAGLDKLPTAGFNTHNPYNKHVFSRTPTEINLEQN